MVLAVVLFMRRMSEVSNVGIVKRELKDEEEKSDPNALANKTVPDDVEIYEIDGPFFFGAAHKFSDIMRSIEKPPKVRIIRMRDVPAIDATGLNLLNELFIESKKDGIHLILSGVHTQPLYALTQYGLFDKIGEQNIYGNIDDALDRARELLGMPKLGRPKEFIPVVKREMKNK